MTRFLTWLNGVVERLCDRPDHLQRLSIVGAGVAVYPLIAVMIGILVWFGVNPAAAAPLVVPIIGNIAYGLLGLFGLVVVALLGIIKGVRASLPGGASVEIQTTSGTTQPEQTT